MPELSVTEEQLERLDALRAELEATFVDGYAHVRRRDVVDYLLDTHTPPAEHVGEGSEAADRSDDSAAVERRVRDALDRTVRDEDGELDYPALQSVATGTEGVKGSGMDAEAMYEAILEAKVREAEANGADAVEIPAIGGESQDVSRGNGATETDAANDEVDGVDGADGTDHPDSADGAEDSADTDGPDASGSGENSGHEGEKQARAAAEGASASGDGSGGSPLQQMMSLLETHDDRWRTAEGGDAPYEVDLPDGGTEAARTKDDVKRILFANY